MEGGGGGYSVYVLQYRSFSTLYSCYNVIQYSVYVNGRRGKMEGGGGGTHGYNTGHSVLCVCEWKERENGGGGGGVLMATIQVIQYSVYVNGRRGKMEGGGGGTHGYNTGHSVLCVCEWKERENGGGGGYSWLQYRSFSTLCM